MKRNHTKISLRRRARWAVGRTQWIRPTYDIGPALVAAVITYVVTLAATPKKTPIDHRALGLPLIAALVSSVAFYLLINLVEFLSKCIKAGGVLRIEDDWHGQTAGISTAQDVTIKNWLRAQLGRSDYRVHFAAVFGSVTGSYATHDIDVIVQFEAASDRRLRKLGPSVKRLNGPFMAEFGLPLHIQLFTSVETEKLASFVIRAEPIEVLVGEMHWDETSALNT